MSNLTHSFTRPIDESAVASMFDRISGRYDFLNRLLSARQDVRWRKNLIAMVPQCTNGTFLDVATGTGDVLLATASSHPEYSRFIGGDISRGMLKFAEIKAANSSANKKITWSVMSAESLQIANSSIDCATISFGLRNVVNKENALREFSRVLKPGGTFLILEFFTPTSGILAKFFQFYFHHILPKIGRLFSEKEAYTYLPKSVASFYSPQELRNCLSMNGFKVNREVNFLFGACRIVSSQKLKY